MIKTKQQSAVSRLWQSINQNWSVAVGFLVLLFILPVAVLVATNTDTKQTTKTTANTDKPLVSISPSNGQGNQQLFIAQVSDANVDSLETAEVWFGSSAPSLDKAPGSYATIKLKNVAVGNGFDWRAVVYTRNANGDVVNSTSLVPDDSAQSAVSKIYSSPSSTPGTISLSTTATATSNASVKYQRVVKEDANTLKFYLVFNFSDNFAPQNTNTYMKAQRGITYGGATSELNGNEWTQVGKWNTSVKQPSALSNYPPKIQSIPSSKATIGIGYSYNITATDPDGDALTYAIYSNKKPAFLNLVNQTLSGTPSAADEGAHPISIIVTDTYGNYSTQSWTIVVAKATAVSPTLKLLTPKAGDKLSGKTFLITWSLSSQATVAGINISYASEGSTTYKKITSVGSDATRYTLDTSTIANGKYSVKIEAVDSNGKVIATDTTPSTVTVDNSSSSTTIGKPRLTGQTPTGKRTDTKKPNITAVLSEGTAPLNSSTLKVTLTNTDTNVDTDLTAKDGFIFTGSAFSYTPKENLPYGNYEVRVHIAGNDAKDGAGELDDSWTFSLSEDKGSVSPIAGTTDTGTYINLPLIGKVPTWLGTILIGFFVLILFIILVFAIIMLIRVLKSNDKDEITQITKYYQQPENVALNTTTTTTTTPTIQNNIATNPLFGSPLSDTSVTTNTTTRPNNSFANELYGASTTPAVSMVTTDSGPFSSATTTEKTTTTTPATTYDPKEYSESQVYKNEYSTATMPDSMTVDAISLPQTTMSETPVIMQQITKTNTEVPGYSVFSDPTPTYTPTPIVETTTPEGTYLYGQQDSTTSTPTTPHAMTAVQTTSVTTPNNDFNPINNPFQPKMMTDPGTLTSTSTATRTDPISNVTTTTTTTPANTPIINTGSERYDPFK